MQKTTTILLTVTFLVGLMGCSGPSAETKGEKSAIDKATDRVAAKAVQKISTPINRAKATQRLGDDRLQALDKALEQK